MSNLKAAKRRNNSVKIIAQYQELFKTSDGKAVLQDLVKDCGVFTSSFSEDTHATAFNEGKRAVALRLIKILKINTDKMNAILAKIDKDIEENQQGDFNE